MAPSTILRLVFADEAMVFNQVSIGHLRLVESSRRSLESTGVAQDRRLMFWVLGIAGGACSGGRQD